METLLLYFFSGLALGSTIALIPSPLLTLLINETLTYGHKEGLKIAFIPSITDFLFIALSVFFMSKIKDMSYLLFGISIAGSLFLTYLGVRSWKSRGIQISSSKVEPQSIKKGVLTNLLNPTPYIFWFTVGTPLLLGQWQENKLFPVFYLLGFYICLLGIRAILAFLVAKFNSLLNSRGYFILTRILSVLLIIFALEVLYQGIKFII